MIKCLIPYCRSCGMEVRPSCFVVYCEMLLSTLSSFLLDARDGHEGYNEGRGS